MEAKLLQELKIQEEKFYGAIRGNKPDDVNVHKRNVIACLFDICYYRGWDLKCRNDWICSLCSRNINRHLSYFGGIILNGKCPLKNCPTEVKQVWKSLREKLMETLTTKYLFTKYVFGRDLAGVIMQPIAFIPELVYITKGN